MYKKFFIGLTCIAISLFMSCVFSKPSLLLKNNPSTSYPPEWKVYGAFYDVDELFMEASYSSTGMVGSVYNKIIINKKIRILTKDGTSYASVPINRFDDSTSIFNVTVIDPLGIEIPIEVSPIKQKFNETGIVVVPQVYEGCLISIYIEYITTNPLTFYEHWFSENIPVRTSRFTFSSIKNYSYEYKGYGGISNPDFTSPKPDKFDYRQWTLWNIVPPTRLGNQRTFDIAEPRVSIVLKNAFNQSVFESWSDLIPKYEKYFFKEKRFNSTKKIKLLIDSLTSGMVSNVDKANTVFHWVQDNISYFNSSIEPANPDAILQNGKGNAWEMIILLREMLECLKFQTDIFVTRPHDYGGFDKDFVTPSVLSVPMLLLEIEKKEYVVFPFRRGGNIGDYPDVFFDLYGISISNKKVRKIPEPLSRKSTALFDYSIHVSQDTLSYTLDLNYEGYLAYFVRGALFSLSKNDITETFQKMLSGLGKVNALKECRIENQTNLAKPFIAHLQFTAPGQVIDHKGTQILRLNNLFDTQFDEYDTNRTSPFTIDYPITISERITVNKKESPVKSMNFECKEISNQLFSTTCDSIENTETILFNRTINKFKCEISPDTMRRLFPSIQELNRIGESNFVF